MALHKTIEMGFRRGVTKVMYPQLPGCGPPLKDFSGPLSGPLATPYLLPYDGARRKLLGIKPPLPLIPRTTGSCAKNPSWPMRPVL